MTATVKPLITAWMLTFLAAPPVGGILATYWAGIWSGIGAYAVLAAVPAVALGIIAYTGPRPWRAT